MSGAKADRALVLGNIGVEFDGFAASWFRRIMCVFGTGPRPCWVRAPARSRRPYHEAVEWRARAEVGGCTFGTWHPNQSLQQMVTVVTVRAKHGPRQPRPLLKLVLDIWS